MSDNTKVTTSTHNPATSITPPSLPTKSTRGDAGSKPMCSLGGKGK